MATREQTYPTGDAGTHEGAFNRVLTRAYTLNWEAIAYTVILVAALVTRFIELGARVMSHDESLHTYYSWNLYKKGDFQHTPLMHGPLLFHMTALSYFLFGDDDFTSRIYPSLLGVLVVMFPLLFRRWLGRVGAVLASIMLLISPQLLYYSRYIRHDIPTIFFALVILYAILQYMDGERPRRPVWLWVMSGALLLMLASKEVSFIYIALFGTFLALFWIFRMVQDIGVARRPRHVASWQPPTLQLVIGHVILFFVVNAIATVLGSFLRFALSAAWMVPSDLWFQVPIFLLLYLPLAFSGLLRSQYPEPGVARMGAAALIMHGLSYRRSAFQIIIAGVILGSVLALIVAGVLDVIKPSDVWQEHQVVSEQYGPGTIEKATRVTFDSAMFVRQLTWIGLPSLLLVFSLFLSAVFIFPGDIPLPWREMLLVLLVALLVMGVLIAVERRSFVEEAQQQAFAADPNAAAAPISDDYNNAYILFAWVLGTVITIGVVATRYLTNWWEFFNRQPMFDVLIVIGTVVLPWASAFPVFLAGYDLEHLQECNTQTGPVRDAINASAITLIPFLMVSISVGLAWNWKRWVPAALVFTGLFVFFFTTVFSNQCGLISGVVGSLGYWLEQQGVRRGSQPQYYYILTQLPVYEFLPMVGAMFAGLSGMAGLWRWHRVRAEAARAVEGAWRSAHPDEDDIEALDGPVIALDGGDADAQIEHHASAGYNPGPEAELAPVEAPVYDESGHYYGGEASLWTRLFRPVDPGEEDAHRAADPEWMGAVPFLALVGYWAIMILLALTMAGEKMPWLTTHLTVPLILISGWWLGRVVTGIRWDAMRDGGWLVLIVAMPLALVALGQVVSLTWGANSPFRGRTPNELLASGTWLAALLLFLGALYLVGRFGRRLGLAQLGRMALVSLMTVLAILTARFAILATYINHDYATEYLVYAHAGPAIKTVMSEVDRIAQITNEGYNMRIAFDDDSSWPFTWYFRNYSNYGLLRGKGENLTDQMLKDQLDGARVVVVGSSKSAKVREYLGDRYYEFGYIRLWWPMQEYFGLNYDRVSNVFSLDEYNAAARYYRQGLFDIWWDRDYTAYGIAMCVEGKQALCRDEAAQGDTPELRDQLRELCQDRIVAECRAEPRQRFDVSVWPVSDRMYMFVDKEVAAQVWDAGIRSSTVDIREPEYLEDRVFRADIVPTRTIGQDLSLNSPRGIAVGPDGNLYVADMQNNRIVVMDANGALVRTIGNQPGGDTAAGSLNQPWGLAIGPDGNLYVADTWNNRVQVFTLDGEHLRMWGHAGIGEQPGPDNVFYGPRDIAVSADGRVYVADTGNKRIGVYTLDGAFIEDLGGPGVLQGQLDEPVGLAINPVSQDLYVAEAWNRRIQVFDPASPTAQLWNVNMWFRNQSSYNRPYLAVEPNGRLVFASDMDYRRRVVGYDLSGNPFVAFTQPENLDAGIEGMRSPAGLAFDQQGYLYVVDADLARVFVFPPLEMFPSLDPVPPGGILAPLDSGVSEGPQSVLPAGTSNTVWEPRVQVIGDVPVAYVPAGCFVMGESSLQLAGGGPQICLSDYWIGQTEVTQAQYAACVTAGACDPLEDETYYGQPDYADYPVVLATWEQAQQYAAWMGGALPTEAQWEYAARGPEGWAYPWGYDGPACDRANGQGCGGLADVGPGQRDAGASWVGALDMAGSAWEWTADWDSPDYYSSLPGVAQDPPGPPSGAERVVRGGSWLEAATSLRATSRAGRDPAERYGTVGFRVILPGDTVDSATLDSTSEQAAGAHDDTSAAPQSFDNESWMPVAQSFQGIPVVYVPAGCFDMGAESLMPDQLALRVCLNDYWIGETEITQAQYAICVAEGKCSEPLAGAGFGDGALADYPVVGITWDQAQQYVTWLGAGLPTDAQWEYAARGPDGWLYPWGFEEPDCTRTNFEDCGGLGPVGAEDRSSGASWVGALDLAGSAWEWTADWASDQRPVQADPNLPLVDPRGPSEGTERLIRGGSWQSPSFDLQAIVSDVRAPASASDELGFRIVVSSAAMAEQQGGVDSSAPGDVEAVG